MTLASSIRPGQTHRVTLNGSNQVWNVEESDTLLGGLLRAGAGVPYECNAGGCGSCKYTLIEGSVSDDLDSTQGLKASDKRKNKHLACISHALGDCTIELKLDDEYRLENSPEKVQASLVDVEKLTHDLWEFSFQSEQKAAFLPGQYAKVFIPGVMGPRSYSMSNIANNQGIWKFSIKRIPSGDASNILFDPKLSTLDVVLDTPYSIAHLRSDETAGVICIAGGSGLGPMVSILNGVADQRGSAESAVLYYGARTEQDVIDPDYFSNISGFDSTKQYIPVVSESSSESTEDYPSGYLHEHLKNTHPDMDNSSEYYIAGPPPMVDAVRKHLVLERGISVNNLHYDRFF